MPAEDDTLARIAEHRRLKQYVLDLAERGMEESVEYAAADDAWDAITWSFIDRPPRTIRGVAALLAYAVEYVAVTGLEWPDNRSYFDDGEDVEWTRALLRALGSALAQ